MSLSVCSSLTTSIISATKYLEIIQFDVKTAFFYGEFNEILYMKQPKGYKEINGI